MARLDEEATGMAESLGWQVKSKAYPLFEVVVTHPRSGKSFLFRFLCDGWDEMPPSFSVHDAKDERELPLSEWPQGGWSIGDHPATGKAFLCLPGVREYHNHSSHVNDAWSGFRERGSYGLLEILGRVQQRFNESSGAGKS